MGWPLKDSAWEKKRMNPPLRSNDVVECTTILPRSGFYPSDVALCTTIQPPTGHFATNGVRIVVQTTTSAYKKAFGRVNCCRNYNIGNHGSPSKLLNDSKIEI